jgi:trypsin
MGIDHSRLVVAALVSVTLATMFQPSTATAVTYGDPVENPQIQYPEVVPVWSGGKALCSGTLIETQVVLTAAHCVYGQTGPFQIAVNGKTLNDGQLYDINALWTHPRYDAFTNQNDIALLHVKKAVNVSRLGSLPADSGKKKIKKYTIVGWGTNQNYDITNQLSALNLDDQTEASRKFFKRFFNPNTMIGAGRFFKSERIYGGGCTGDSGGPLFEGANGGNHVVVGITSFGARGCKQFQPTIFTKVAYYLDQIRLGIPLLKERASSAPIETGKAAPTGKGIDAKPEFLGLPYVYEEQNQKSPVSTSYDIRNGRFVNFNCAPNLSPSNSSGTTWRVRWYVWVYNPANSNSEQDKVLADLEIYSWDNFILSGRFRNAYFLKCEVIATSSGGTTSALSNGVRILVGN